MIWLSVPSPGLPPYDFEKKTPQYDAWKKCVVHFVIAENAIPTVVAAHAQCNEDVKHISGTE